MPPSLHVRRRRNGQRGFSLIVVFLLILVMVGVSAGVMLSTQGDLQVSGHDRESVTALYAAEAGAAWAQGWLQQFTTPVLSGTWSPMLAAGAGGPLAPAMCVLAPGASNPPAALPVGGAATNFVPGSLAVATLGVPVRYDTARSAWFQWCVHNNAIDPSYAQVGLPNPNITDGDNIVTIESWGWVGGDGTFATALASSHITVDVLYSNANLLLANDYAQGLGGALKRAGAETSSTVAGGQAKVF